MHQTLLIHCQDQMGLMAKVMNLLYRRQLNVTNINNNVNPQTNLCTLQTEFEGSINLEELLEDLRQQLPTEAEISFQIESHLVNKH